MKSGLLFALRASWNYYFSSKNIHQIDSPYLFRFCKEVIETKSTPGSFRRIEQLRSRLLKDFTRFDRTDFGAGSQNVKKNNNRTVAEFVNSSAAQPWNGALLNRIVRFAKPTTILELGTAAGISGAYMMQDNLNCRLITIEGDPVVASLAKANFNALSMNQVEVVTGSFETMLPEILDKNPKLDFILIDGHHTGKALIAYTDLLYPYLNPQSGIIVLDDIHWNQDMNLAWNKLKMETRWQISIDVFRYGILIRNPDLAQHHQFSLIKSIYKPWKLGLFR